MNFEDEFLEMKRPKDLDGFPVTADVRTSPRTLSGATSYFCGSLSARPQKIFGIKSTYHIPVPSS